MSEETCTAKQFEIYLEKEARMERRELFKAVALENTRNGTIRPGETIESYGDMIAKQTEAILKAASEFEKEGE